MKAFKINSKSIISRDNICMNDYLRDIKSIKLLTPEEEVTLARIIKEGGREAQKAKEQLVKANLRFVISVANTYKGTGMDLCDLIAEGNFGLIKAAETFDETRNVRFITYAVSWIRHYINEAVIKYGNIVHLPTNQHRILSNYFSKCDEVMKTEGRTLSIEEYAKTAKISASKLKHIFNVSHKASSLDVSLGDGSDRTFLDLLPSDYKTDSRQDLESFSADTMRIINSVLTDNEAYVICHHYGIGCTQETLTDIGYEMGLSCERTRQINKSALKKLHNSSAMHGLVGYLAA